MSPTAVERLDKWYDKTTPVFPQEKKAVYDGRNYSHDQLRNKNYRQSQKETEAQGRLALHMLNPLGQAAKNRELERRQYNRKATDMMLKERNVAKKEVPLAERSISFMSGLGLGKLVGKPVKPHI